MRYVVLAWVILSLLMGQTPNLRWAELADTVYGLGPSQDTFLKVIQSRSGNIRRFDRYDRVGGTLTWTEYDSIYLDGSGRLSRIRRYHISGNNPPAIEMEVSFTYPGTPTVKAVGTDGVSPTIQGEAYCYGLMRMEGSYLLLLLMSDGPEALEVYPATYHRDQIRDSIVVRSISDGIAFGIAYRMISGGCDSAFYYAGLLNGPLFIGDSAKVCETNDGRIDSMISGFNRLYWSYDAGNRPTRVISVADTIRDTIDYTYDGSGRLIETWQRGDTSGRPYARRYVLRYAGLPGALAYGGEPLCFTWDAMSRRGSLACLSAQTRMTLQLYDLYGRIVWEGQVQGAEYFELPRDLPPGLYHLRIGTHPAARLYLFP